MRSRHRSPTSAEAVFVTSTFLTPTVHSVRWNNTWYKPRFRSRRQETSNLYLTLHPAIEVVQLKTLTCLVQLGRSNKCFWASLGMPMPEPWIDLLQKCWNPTPALPLLRGGSLIFLASALRQGGRRGDNLTFARGLICKITWPFWQTSSKLILLLVYKYFMAFLSKVL